MIIFTHFSPRYSSCVTSSIIENNFSSYIVHTPCIIEKNSFHTICILENVYFFLLFFRFCECMMLILRKTCDLLRATIVHAISCVTRTQAESLYCCSNFILYTSEVNASLYVGWWSSNQHTCLSHIPSYRQEWHS